MVFVFSIYNVFFASFIFILYFCSGNSTILQRQKYDNFVNYKKKLTEKQSLWK
jgi:hypothetical protein